MKCNLTLLAFCNRNWHSLFTDTVKSLERHFNMKRLSKHLVSFLLVCGIQIATTLQGSAQVAVTVNNANPWSGFMNVYDLAGGSAQGGYLWGSSWAIADLRATISGPTLTLSPNVSQWLPSDSYWVNAGQPNKWMEANFYVDVGTDFAGKSVTFSGDTIANTLVSPYSSVAVIKEFGPGYSWIGMTTVALVGGSPFSVTRDIGAGNIAQYGFLTQGPNADPATVASWGVVSLVVVPEPTSLSLLGFGILGLILIRRGQN